MMNYNTKSKCFIINFTFFGYYSWLPEVKRKFKIGCMVLEEKEESEDDLTLYTYHWLFFDKSIKKILTKVFLSKLPNYFKNRHLICNNEFTDTFLEKLTNVEIIEETLSHYKDDFGKYVVGGLVNSAIREYYVL